MNLGASWIDDVAEVINSLIPKYNNLTVGTLQRPFQAVYVQQGIAGKFSTKVPAGSTISDATLLTSAITDMTGSPGATTGIKLNDDFPVGNAQYIYNRTDSTIKLYPPDANGILILNGTAGSAGASATLTMSGTFLVVKGDDGIHWYVTLVG